MAAQTAAGWQESNTAKYLKSIYSISTPQEMAAIYDTWAQSYDADVVQGAVDYIAPRAAAQRLTAAIGDTRPLADVSILDAGCGTGLVAVALARQHGARTIDGLDLSPGMLREARKTGAYRDLLAADMNRRLEIADETYDAVTCCGTFTTGHVGPDPALRELVRVAKRGGVVVVTIVEAVYESEGFDAVIEGLVRDGVVTVEENTKEAYRTGSVTLAHFVVLRRSHSSFFQ